MKDGIHADRLEIEEDEPSALRDLAREKSRQALDAGTEREAGSLNRRTSSSLAAAASGAAEIDRRSV
jgi:hypothetical protein